MTRSIREGPLPPKIRAPDKSTEAPSSSLSNLLSDPLFEISEDGFTGIDARISSSAVGRPCGAGPKRCAAGM